MKAEGDAGSRRRPQTLGRWVRDRTPIWLIRRWQDRVELCTCYIPASRSSARPSPAWRSFGWDCQWP